MRRSTGLLLRMRRYLRREPGNATLEFVIWFPLFIFMLLVVVDMSMFYLNQTRMHNVSRDASRRMSVGVLEATQLSTYVSGQLAGGGYTIVNCSDAESSCVRIERAVEETLVFGSWIGAVLGDNFIVQTTTPFEPEPI